MEKTNLQISSEELSKFVDNQGDDNYQHVKEVMNSLGKHPIIPAFQTISKIWNNEISDELKKAKHLSVEGLFSSIICPGETIAFRKDEDDDGIAFEWENPNRFLKNFGFKSFVGITFRFNDRYESSTAHLPYSRRLPILESKLQSFSEIIGSRKHNLLTDMFYTAAYATSIIVLSFKDPRNEFEDRVFSLKNNNDSTPFYKYIRINFNKNIQVVPADVLYEFNGRIRGTRTVSINFRTVDPKKELLNGILEVDFIAKNSVLKFTKDLPSSDIAPNNPP